MTLRTLWCIALLAGPALTGCQQPEPAGRPPNLVVIVVDDLRWDDLGIEGHPFAQTPAIDRLAREGARFGNAASHPKTGVRKPGSEYGFLWCTLTPDWMALVEKTVL